MIYRTHSMCLVLFSSHNSHELYLFRGRKTEASGVLRVRESACKMDDGVTL